MNEEVKKEENNTEVNGVSENNTVQNENVTSNEVVTENTNVNVPAEEVKGSDVPQTNKANNTESLIDKENVNLAPITKPTVHFDNKPEVTSTVNPSVTETPVNNNISKNTPLNNSTNNGNVSGEFIEKEKKKWPIVLLLVLLVLGGAFYYYYFVMTKPSTLFNKVIEATYTKLSNKIETNINDTVKKYNKGELSGKFILTSENADLVMVNGLTVNMNLGFDKDNKKVYVGGSGSLLGIEMASAKALLDGDYVYFNIKKSGVEGATYKTKIDTSTLPTEEENIDLEKYKNSYKYLIDLGKKTFLANVSESKITKTPELRTVNGKKTPAYKINYTYDEDENKKIKEAILNAYMNDNKALEELVNLGIAETTEEAKTSLKDIIDGKSLDQDCSSKDCVEVDNFKTINIVIYIDMLNNNLLGFDMGTDNDKLNVTVNGESYNAILTYKNEKDETMSYSISLSYDSNENRYVLDVDMPSVVGSIINGVSSNTDPNYVKKDYRTKFSLVYKENKVNDKKTEYTSSFKYFEPTNIEKEYFVIDITGEFNVVDNIKTFDTTNAIDYDALDENAKKEILNSLIGENE